MMVRIIPVEPAHRGDDANSARWLRTASVEVVFRKVPNQASSSEHQGQGVNDCALASAVRTNENIVVAESNVRARNATEAVDRQGK
jgi:hypothetical protein